MKKELFGINIPQISVNDQLNFDTYILNQLDKTNPNIPGILRVWESPDYAVVLGKSNKIDKEVYEENCRRDNIPIIKRESGGGTVLLGPGCLCYTLILNIHTVNGCHTISSTNTTALSNLIEALQPLNMDIQTAGHTDLVVNNIKISGNAQKRKKNYLLFHGTILYNLNIELIHAYLKFPSKYPEYREKRNHNSFVKNITYSYMEIMNVIQNHFIKKHTESDEKHLEKIIITSCEEGALQYLTKDVTIGRNKHNLHT